MSGTYYVLPGMTGGTLCFRVVRPSFHPPRFRGTTLRAAPSKNYAFSTNYHACIAMPTWPRCAPPILCWPWPPYNFLLRSCLTWIFISRGAEGPGREILQRPPSVCPSVCPSVRLSVTFSFRTVTQKRIAVFSQNFAGMCTKSWGCAV